MLLHAADVNLLINPDRRCCWLIRIAGFAAAVFCCCCCCCCSQHRLIKLLSSIGDADAPDVDVAADWSTVVVADAADLELYVNLLVIDHPDHWCCCWPAVLLCRQQSERIGVLPLLRKGLAQHMFCLLLCLSIVKFVGSSNRFDSQACYSWWDQLSIVKLVGPIEL